MTRRVEHVITGLGVGGAELILSRLARGGTRFEHAVTSLSPTGHIADELSAANVEVTTLGMKKNLMALRQVGRLAARLRETSPGLVQTWLYHADLVGGLAARRAGVPVVWNLRQTNVGRGGQKINTAIVVRLCALLSRSIPVKIVCGSKAAREAHRRMGFDAGRMVVISNGVDTRVFRPDPEAEEQVRRELGIDAGAKVVGRVGRFHPQKDYHGFVKAARIISDSDPGVCFVLAGENIDWNNRELADWIRQAGLGDRFHLLGARNDIARLMAAMDVFVSSSIYGEGFPNVIAEALACAVPCVATDVGDSAEIIGRPDRVVPPGEYGALARAAAGVLSQDDARRRRDGEKGRNRVTGLFALDEMINRYETLYEQVLKVANERIATGAGT